ncbi:hypothetical protein [Lactobacillus amylovorus]|uniref:hypothetical protein n=1 Tax=Lactobacillus amylovorus TaxID=1604 RepID=UPI00201E69EF|nr:hypothetical protein [Lactobacillus amylovorus]
MNKKVTKIALISMSLLALSTSLSACSSDDDTSSSSKTSQTQKKLKYNKVNIDNASDDYVTYKFKSFETHDVSIKDNWSIAPATINKVEVAMLKNSKTLKVQGQVSSNPLPKKEKIKGFVFVTVNIPKAYKANLTVGIDAGAAAFPKYDDIMLSGLIIPGQKGQNLANKYDHCYDIQGESDFDNTTEQGTLNIQKMLVAVPIPESVNKYQPLKIRFNAHDDQSNSHLYQFNIKW